MTDKNRACTGSVTIARPNNTTAYAIGDAIGVADTGTPANAGSAVLTFPSMGPEGSHVLITSIDLLVALAALPSGMTGFYLHLYDQAPAARLDNEVWDLVAGDRDKYLGYIEYGTPGDSGATLFTQTDAVNKQVRLAPSSSTLYGILVTKTAFTPTANESYTPRLRTAAL